MTIAWEPTAPREKHTRTVLNILRSESEPVSRKMLARRSGLSSVTIGKIVRDLEHVGFVREFEEGPRGTGRPSSMVSLNSAGGYVVGVLPREDSISGVIMDLRGVTVGSATTREPVAEHPEAFVELLSDFIRDLIDQSGIPRERFVGVGLGLPGHIDAEEGRCIDAWALGLRDIDIVAPLTRGLGLSILLDNDTNCLGAYEVLFGRQRDLQQFFVVSVGKGLGMAIVIDGLIYRGATGSAGDFGHSRVVGLDRACECGRTGCVETVASDRGIERNYLDSTGEHATVQDIIHRAESGEANAREAIKIAGRILGQALASATQLLDPAGITLVLADGVAHVGALFLESLQTELNKSSQLSTSSLLVETVGYQRWAEGAASLALGQFFTPGAIGIGRVKDLASEPA